MFNWKQATREPSERTNREWLKQLTHWCQPKRAGLLGFCIAIGTAGLFSGCTSLNSSIGSIFSGGCMSDAIELHRNRTCALKAWFRREHNFCDQPYLRDFKEGFVDGYVAIAEGKPGCPPSVPPKRFWSWAYQTPEGQAQMAAWYAGYPYGVQAAKDDGLSNRNHITLGPNFQTNRQNQNWGSYNGQPYSPANNYDASPMPIFDGGSGQPSNPAPDASILQDSSARNIGNSQAELFSDPNLTLVE